MSILLNTHSPPRFLKTSFKFFKLSTFRLEKMAQIRSL
jgi:hypothetical protein